MPTRSQGRSSAKRKAGKGASKGSSGSSARPPKRQRRRAHRMAKEGLLQRIKTDTQQVTSGSILKTLRKQGYDEIPLDEIQDRLSKLRDPLAELILLGRK